MLRLVKMRRNEFKNSIGGCMRSHIIQSLSNHVAKWNNVTVIVIRMKKTTTTTTKKLEVASSEKSGMVSNKTWHLVNIKIWIKELIKWKWRNG